MKEFKAKFYNYDKQRYTNSMITDTYYASGEEDIKDRDLCINLKDHSQIVISVKSIIKLLKKEKRI